MRKTLWFAGKVRTVFKHCRWTCRAQIQKRRASVLVFPRALNPKTLTQKPWKLWILNQKTLRIRSIFWHLSFHVRQQGVNVAVWANHGSAGLIQVKLRWTNPLLTGMSQQVSIYLSVFSYPSLPLCILCVYVYIYTYIYTHTPIHRDRVPQKDRNGFPACSKCFFFQKFQLSNFAFHYWGLIDPTYLSVCLSVYLSHPILSCPVLSCPIVSYPVLPYLVLSCLVFSNLI